MSETRNNDLTARVVSTSDHHGNDAPLFSIVIPTGGRQHTILSTLRTCLCQAGSDIEFIISDNDSSGGTAKLLAGIYDARIRYLKTSERLSMTEHWNFALSAARGEYVLLLGDDDGLLIDAIGRARKVIETVDVDVLFANLHFYQWPGGDMGGIITRLAPETREGFVDVPRQARRVLQLGGARWETLPSVYRAFIRRRVLDRLRVPNQSYCETFNPDMYTGFSIAGIPGIRTYKLRDPIAICAMSYLMSEKPMPRVLGDEKERGALAQHIGEFRDVSLAVPLPHVLPRMFNSFAESILLAIKRFPDMYRGETLNLTRHYAWMASWSKAGTVADFWLLKRALAPYGFKFRQFIPWFFLYRIWHVFSAWRTPRKASKRVPGVTLDNVFDAACFLTRTNASRIAI